jgi:hypothetical protein
MKYGVVLFHTTSSTIQAQKILTGKGYNVTLIPTPRQYSSDCGISIRFNWHEHALVEEELIKARVEIQSIQALE